MNTKIDVFAHVLPINFFNKIKSRDPNVIAENPFLKIASLSDFSARRSDLPKGVKQVVSNVGLNPEDYFDSTEAAEVSYQANEELLKIVSDNSDIFEAAVGMLPMNNVSEAVKLLEEQVTSNDKLWGFQLFTRAAGRSIASPEYEPIFEKAAQLNVPLWLHPVFDDRKPDNNITFSWEYELTQAMYQIVKARYFEKYPNLKIIIHHAGAMVPFFAERIRRTMSDTEYADFKKFYVDTAILGNTKALELALDFYGKKHLLFGTDAPFAIAPTGATKEIVSAIDQMDVDSQLKQAIYYNNLIDLLD